MKYLLIIFLLICTFAKADYYERVVDQKHIFLDTGVEYDSRDKILSEAYAKSKLCGGCPIRFESKITTVTARLVVTSKSSSSSRLSNASSSLVNSSVLISSMASINSSEQSSDASSHVASSARRFVIADAPQVRIDGKILTCAEHGGYQIRINDTKEDIPYTSCDKFSYEIKRQIEKDDVIKLSFYDKNKLYSDAIEVLK